MTLTCDKCRNEISVERACFCEKCLSQQEEDNYNQGYKNGYEDAEKKLKKIWKI